MKKETFQKMQEKVTSLTGDLTQLQSKNDSLYRENYNLKLNHSEDIKMWASRCEKLRDELKSSNALVSVKDYKIAQLEKETSYYERELDLLRRDRDYWYKLVEKQAKDISVLSREIEINENKQKV
jgi:chromosome segregation ATPase